MANFNNDSIAMVSGTWTNELRSTVTFILNDGFITGTYQTAVVSNPEKNEVPLERPLSGTYQVIPNGLLLTFAVNWVFETKDTKEKKYSITTWIGQYYTSHPNYLNTTWLLQSDVDRKDSWSACRINKDFFTKA